MPFGFWNGDITRQGISDQLEDFRAHGIGGVVIHPRMGLSPAIGCLTPEYLELHRHAIEEAQRLGMWVILYDEGMYSLFPAKQALCLGGHDDKKSHGILPGIEKLMIFPGLDVNHIPFHDFMILTT